MSANQQLLRWIEKLRAHRGFCRWVHLTCFCAWLTSAEGIGPGACAWLASLHQVEEVVVSAKANGPAEVILTREKNMDHLEPRDPLLDALHVMRQAFSERLKVHVLSFHALDDGRRPDTLYLEEPVFMAFDTPMVRYAHAIDPRPPFTLKSERATVFRQPSPPIRVMRC